MDKEKKVISPKWVIPLIVWIKQSFHCTKAIFNGGNSLSWGAMHVII